jgi:energy-coupling factor transporter ATP-binding protein EcfA2
MQRYVKVDFYHFKAFKRFTLNLRDFNILVGPNHAGKSTILAAFRILAAGIRKALSKRPEIVSGTEGQNLGYIVDLSNISVAAENIYYNYDDSELSKIVFTLSSGDAITLYFPEQSSCRMVALRRDSLPPRTPTEFRKYFNAPIGFVPILGPVDHEEILYEREAARLALFSYRAARNFRNIWHHYPDKFDEFRRTLIATWPGMDIQPPVIDTSDRKPRLHMFCPESRIPREIFWSGFGFQVWCQMLTHLIQSKESSIFLIDEPDIYLHSDLQRQLLSLLRNLGPDILIATHSTEIISDAEPDEIVVINKKKLHASRVKNPSQLSGVFSYLGSNLNPILTQLAKTRRAIFVEGKDFQVISKFASKLGASLTANRGGFAVIPVDGFNPERAKNILSGMEMTLGGQIHAAVVFDRDYRSDGECSAIREECLKFCDLAVLHDAKEIENFLLVPSAIDRAVSARLDELERRGAGKSAYVANSEEILEEFVASKKSYVAAQFVSLRKQFERRSNPGINEASTNEMAIVEFESAWKDSKGRILLVPGKEAFAHVNKILSESAKISITPTLVIDRMKIHEVPIQIADLIASIEAFAGE